MPSYDFVCQDCETRYEVRLSMSAYAEGAGRTCTRCGSARVERAFTAVTVIAGSRSGGGAPSGGGCEQSGFT